MPDLMVDPRAVAQALQSEIAGELDALVASKVTAALKAFEDKWRDGLSTPDGGTADQGIKSFGDFLLALVRKDYKRLETVYKSKTIKLNEQDGTEGGYTVPAPFDARLLEVAGSVNPIDLLTGNRAPMTIPMTSRTLTMPALDQTSIPADGTSAFDAGVVAQWTAESATKPYTEPKFKNVELNAHKLAGYTTASNELEADTAVALDALLTRLFGMAVGHRRLHAFLRGDGVGKPLGVRNAPAAIAVTRTGGGNAFDAADVPAMVRRLYPGSMTNAVWFIHPFIISDMATMSFGTNNVLSWGDIRTGNAPALFGIPYYPTEFMSAPGTAFDVLLADWSYYLIGNRESTTIAVSDHVRFLQDERTWRFVHRVDGQPWPSAATTLSDGTGTNTVSPFVYLS